MPIHLNHTIVHARDPVASARFLAEILGLREPKPFGPFMGVDVDNGVTLGPNATAQFGVAGDTGTVILNSSPSADTT